MYDIFASSPVTYQWPVIITVFLGCLVVNQCCPVPSQLLTISQLEKIECSFFHKNMACAMFEPTVLLSRSRSQGGQRCCVLYMLDLRNVHTRYEYCTLYISLSKLQPSLKCLTDAQTKIEQENIFKQTDGQYFPDHFLRGYTSKYWESINWAGCLAVKFIVHWTDLFLHCWRLRRTERPELGGVDIKQTMNVSPYSPPHSLQGNQKCRKSGLLLSVFMAFIV